MKDQYFGDVNDYRKYRLLRALTRSGANLGVCWMLTESDGRSDGRHLAVRGRSGVGSVASATGPNARRGAALPLDSNHAGHLESATTKQVA